MALRKFFGGRGREFGITMTYNPCEPELNAHTLTERVCSRVGDGLVPLQFRTHQEAEKYLQTHQVGGEVKIVPV